MAYGKKAERSTLKDDEKFRAILQSEMDAAIQYVDGELAEERTKATEYYRGDLFGDEIEGRSKVVMTVLRDVVTAVLPPLMRVFAGSDRVAEFQAPREDKVEQAEQATDYVNHVVLVDNPGFLMMHTLFKDALTRSIGVAKWWWEEKRERTEERYTGLDMPALESALAEYPDAEVVDGEIAEDGTISICLRRDGVRGRVRLQALPPEEFLVNRSARSIDESRYCAHRRTDLTVADLVAMGYDEDEVLEHSSPDTALDLNEERVTREEPYQSDDTDEPVDPRMRPVLYVESYIEVPDEDGIPVLRKVCSVGPQAHILHEEIVDERPFADFCPDPEPHTINGSGYFQRTKDLQRIMSHLVRGILDSLTEAIHPRTAFVEGSVNVDDLLNPEVAGLVRMTAPGMVQPLAQPFVGSQALPVVELFTGIKEDRTGVSRAASGLDADALQSSTRMAVEATVKAAEAQIELIARMFAEGGFKRMMRGVYHTLRRHQQQDRVIKLRGGYVPVNPATWDADLDVVVNVGLGTGTPEAKMAVLGQMIERQEMWIEKMGPDNQLAGFRELRNSVAAFLELAGRRDVGRFLKAYNPQAQQAPPQPQQQSDPAQLLAQVEMQKMQLDNQHKMSELQLKQWEAKQRDDRERDRLDVDMHLRAAELSMKYSTQVDIASIRADVDRERNKAQITAQAQPPAGGA